MALPLAAIAAGAARGIGAVGRGIGAAGRGIGRGARGLGRGTKKRLAERIKKRPLIEEPPIEAEEEAPEDETTRKLSALLSPEGAILLPTAIILDIVGIVCLILDIFFGVGEILSWVSDGVGIIFICGWMWFRSGRVEVPGRVEKRAERGLRRLFRGKWKRFLTPIIGEVAPFVGALPFWSLAVYFELTS